MKTLRSVAALAAAAALLGGCTGVKVEPFDPDNGLENDADLYQESGTPVAAGVGTIESIQVTNGEARGEGRTSGAGAVVGGLVGAVAGNQVGSGSGRTAATVAGGVAGAVIGNRVEASRDPEGPQRYGINVRMDNGEYRSVAQDDVYDLRVGSRVRVVEGRVYRY